MNHDLASESLKYNNDEKWFELLMRCTEFPSVNNQYGINTHSKSVFLLPHVRKFINELTDQLVISDPKSLCPWILPSGVYFLRIYFIIKREFWSRDVDNMVKVTQDTIFRNLNLNDSHIVESHHYKCFNPGDYEYLIVKVGLTDFNYQQFKI